MLDFFLSVRQYRFTIAHPESQLAASQQSFYWPVTHLLGYRTSGQALLLYLGRGKCLPFVFSTSRYAWQFHNDIDDKGAKNGEA